MNEGEKTERVIICYTEKALPADEAEKGGVRKSPILPPQLFVPR